MRFFYNRISKNIEKNQKIWYNKIRKIILEERMNRKLVKILSIVFIIIQIILITNVVFATSGSELAKSFNGQSSSVDTNSGINIIKKSIGPVLSIVRIVAVGISVIMITYLGIQYMSAAPQEKADIKNKLITFTIGAIIVVGAATLLGIIKNFADSSITA